MSKKFYLIPLICIFLLTTCRNTWIEDITSSLNYNNIDFGRGASITSTFDIYGHELYNTLNEITVPGNYVINLSNDTYFSGSVNLPEDTVISIRGNNNKITFYTSLNISNGVKLILRDVIISHDYMPASSLFYVDNLGVLIMEAGSILTSSSSYTALHGVFVGDGGTFIMNDGIVYGMKTELSIVMIEGANARFEANQQAVLFGSDAHNTLKNTSGGDHLLYINPASSDPVFRKATINKGETLSVTTDSSGNISQISGNWSGDTVVIDDPDPNIDIDLSGEISITPNINVAVGRELTAVYTGSENVTYQWKRDATNVGTNSNKYTPTAAGSYTVTVSATGYNSKTSAVVEVMTEAAITIIYNNQDFGGSAEPTELRTVDLSSDPDYALQNVFSEIDSLGPGNYVINVSGDDAGAIGNLALGRWVVPSGDIVVSLRGDGTIIDTSNYDAANIGIWANAKLILRGVIISQHENSNFPPTLIHVNGTLVMEEGSAITGISTGNYKCSAGIVVGDGGTFIMNGGEIYGLETTFNTVTISGPNARFEKNGGIIYGIGASADSNSPETGYVVRVDTADGITYYRNTTIGEDETLSIVLDDDGNVLHISDGWLSE